MLCVFDRKTVEQTDQSFFQTFKALLPKSREMIMRHPCVLLVYGVILRCRFAEIMKMRCIIRSTKFFTCHLPRPPLTDFPCLVSFTSLSAAFFMRTLVIGPLLQEMIVIHVGIQPEEKNTELGKYDSKAALGNSQLISATTRKKLLKPCVAACPNCWRFVY